jgi:List-Bact-rpt repeat protein/fibronectin type III domain protein
LIRRSVFVLALALLLSGCTTIAELGWNPWLPPVPNYSLTVIKAGTGQGTVTAPPSLNCGTTCQTGYAANNVVTLTATQTAGSSFASWSGGCTGTLTTCQVTMSSAKTVTATFNVAAGDTTPPAVPGTPVIGTATLGPTSVSYPVTWTASLDQPCNCLVSKYHWDVNDYHWTQIITAGETTTNSLTLIMPYDPSGESVIAHFGVSAVDAAGNDSGVVLGHAFADFIVPANPNTNAKLTANWSAPTNNTDGSPLTDLSGYRVYYGTGAGNPCPSGSFVAAGLVTSIPITGLLNGTTYTSSIVAVNSANVASACSATTTGVAHP